MAIDIPKIENLRLEKGETAYDFRQRVNQIIEQSNESYIAINNQIAGVESLIVDSKDSAIKDITRVRLMALSNIEAEVSTYLKEFDENIVDIYISDEQPSGEQLPQFWYKIEKDIINGIKLVTSDGYVLKDSNGKYLLAKEDN